MNLRPKLVSREETNRRFAQKKKAAGYKMLSIWVPKNLIDEVKAFVKMRGAV